MASSKISELTSTTTAGDNDLLLISSTTDGGTTYTSKHIKISDLEDDLTLLHTQISDFDAGVQTNRLDQLAAPTADVTLNGQKITNLAAPVSDNDAVNKAYVDAVKTGLDVKDSVRAATTANITLSGTQTVDGVSLAAGDRVLVKNQTTGSQNGIYVVAAGAWSRSADADNSPSGEVTSGMFTFVEEGTTYAASGWVLQTTGAITLDTTSLSFVQFSGAGQLQAGTFLTINGNTISVSSDFQADVSDLVSLTGVAANGTTLGTGFSVIADGETIAGALADLDAAVAANDGDITDIRSAVGIADGDTNLGTFTGATIANSSTVKSALQALETSLEEVDGNANSLITLSGVGENATSLGTFTGGTIADSSTIKAALQALETSVETKAASSIVTEIDGNVDDLVTLSGVAENSTGLGTFSGTTISDNATIKAALQSLETGLEAKAASSVVTEIDGNVDDLISLSGVAENASNLGTFTGSTISDSTTIKGALQQLETSVEAKAASSVVTEIDGNVNDLVTLTGVGENVTSLGTFTGSVIADNVSIKAALQALETAVESSNFVDAGDNVNRLVGSTSADTEPANWLFLVVDTSNGAIKAIDKTFVEIE